jgi:hypothetical protein
LIFLLKSHEAEYAPKHEQRGDNHEEARLAAPYDLAFCGTGESAESPI